MGADNVHNNNIYKKINNTTTTTTITTTTTTTTAIISWGADPLRPARGHPTAGQSSPVRPELL